MGADKASRGSGWIVRAAVVAADGTATLPGDAVAIAAGPRRWLPLRTRPRRVLVAAALAAAAAAGVLTGCDGAKPDSTPEHATEVSLAVARQSALPIEIQARGHVVAINQVEVRSRIDGIVRRIGFVEGGQVEAGQVLFELDAEDAVAEHARARAEVVRARAELEDAVANLARSRELEASGYISSSAIDTLESRRNALHAQLQAARAALDGAQAHAARATIRAPFRARAGMALVREGGRVRQADPEPLVVLRQFDPIGIEFAIPERQLHAVVSARDEVGLQVVTEAGASIEGALAVVDNSIDPGTGTIRLRAELANADDALWPGAFVRVMVRVASDQPVTVLPPQAVIEGPEGHFVYVVDAEGIAVETPVTLLRIQQGLAVVDGLEAGRQIVVEGARSLRDGGRVRAIGQEQAVAVQAGDDRGGGG